MHYGELIKKTANALGLSANDVATKTGKHLQTVYVDYKKEHLNTEVIEEYCRGFSISVVDMFVGVGLSHIAELNKSISQKDIDDYTQRIAELEKDKTFLKNLVEMQATEREKILKNYFDLVQQKLQQNAE